METDGGASADRWDPLEHPTNWAEYSQAVRRAKVWRLAAEIMARYPQRIAARHGYFNDLYEVVSLVDLDRGGQELGMLNCAGTAASCGTHMMRWPLAYDSEPRMDAWIEEWARRAGLPEPTPETARRHSTYVATRWIADFLDARASDDPRWMTAADIDPREWPAGAIEWARQHAGRTQLLVHLVRDGATGPEYTISPDADLWTADGHVDLMEVTRLPINRKERYYTATVLPMIIASDDMRHLNLFLALCGLARVDVGPHNMWEVQFLTEYGFAESLVARDRAPWAGAPNTRDTPDIVIVGPDWLVVIEGKMFHNPNAATLAAQMRVQRTFVDAWAERLRIPPERVKCVALVPKELDHTEGYSTSGETTVLTWEDVWATFEGVAPRYWLRQLSDALTDYAALKSEASDWGKHATDRLSGQTIMDRYNAGDPALQSMGRRGGLYGPDLAEDVATGNWRTQKYEVTSAEPPNANWFSITSFAALTAEQ